MIVVMGKDTPQNDIERVVAVIKKAGLGTNISVGSTKTIVGIIGDESKIEKEVLESFDFVEKVMPIQKPYRRAAREAHPDNTIVDVGNGVKFGGSELVMVAGPCSVESEDQMFEIANQLKGMGVKVMRSSAYKPRTSPYAFQGMGLAGLKIIKKIGKEVGLITETEVMDTRNIEVVAEHVDILIRAHFDAGNNHGLTRFLPCLNGPCYRIMISDRHPDTPSFRTLENRLDGRKRIGIPAMHMHIHS